MSKLCLPFLGLAMFLFASSGNVAAMSFSSVSVVGNALRLRTMRLT